MIANKVKVDFKQLIDYFSDYEDELTINMGLKSCLFEVYETVNINLVDDELTIKGEKLNIEIHKSDIVDILFSMYNTSPFPVEINLKDGNQIIISPY